MPLEVIFLVLGIVFGVGGIILLGYRMHYRHEERLQQAEDPGEVRELRQAVEELQEEVRVLQEGAAGFDERLEFTERLLAKPSSKSESTG